MSMDSTRNICETGEKAGGRTGQYPDGRPYCSLPLFLRQQFGGPLYKLSLNGGMSCPNRDKTVGDGGCIFCSAGGSGEFAADAGLSVSEQIAQARRRAEAKAEKASGGRQKDTGNGEGGGRKEKGNPARYIAYFQAYTNTYAPPERLERIFTEALRPEDVAVLSIATRPDCLGEPVIRLLDRLAEKKPVWVELGLQTMHEETAIRIRRGYALPCFEQAVRRLQAGGHMVIVHMILGLPGESREQMAATARYLGDLGVDGVKLQLLHILKGTVLGEWYERGQVSVMEKEEYFAAVAACLQVLPRRTVIHRLTGDGPKELLLAPFWSRDKKRVLNELHHYLKIHGIWQGQNLAGRHAVATPEQ